MGIDLLELVMEVEQRTGANIHPDAFADISRPTGFWRRPDCTAGELHAALLRATHVCLKCGYDLRGHAVTGACPECGHAFRQAAIKLSWEEFREILAGVTGRKVERITRESFVGRDLGLE